MLLDSDVIKVYDEILCRKPENTGLQNYKNKKQDVNWLRSELFKSSEYNNQLKNTSIIYYIRYKNYSGNSLCISAERYISFLRNKYNVSSIEFTDTDTSETIIQILSQLVFNHSGNKKLFIHSDFRDWIIQIISWWITQSEQNTTFSPFVVGYFNYDFFNVVNIPFTSTLSRWFNTICVPSNKLNSSLFEISMSPTLRISTVPYVLKKYTKSVKRYDENNPIIIYSIDNSTLTSNFIMTVLWTIQYIVSSEYNNIKYIIKSKNTITINSIQSYISQLIYKPNITIINEILPSDKHQEIHQIGHIYTSLSGLKSPLSMCEALSEGNIVICPNVGNCIEYLPNDYPFFIQTSKDMIGTYVEIHSENSFVPKKWFSNQDTTRYFDTLNIALDLFTHNEHLYLIENAQNHLYNLCNTKNIEQKLDESIGLF